MTREYLHLSAYRCDQCQGPVVTGSLAVRENEISKETDKREIGAICLSCGHRQIRTYESRLIRQFPPVEWQSINAVGPAGNSSRVELDRVSRD